MFNSRKAVCILSVLVVACVPMALAQGTYTQFDVPGAIGGTFGVGVDAAGDVSGFYSNLGGYYHGFLLRQGNYTTIDYPGASSTMLLGINAGGTELVGNGTVGFVYEIQTGTFTTLSYPGATSTGPFVVNDAGVVGGYAARGTTLIGFELTGSGYLRIVPPGATSTAVRGVSTLGKLIGLSSKNGVTLNFTFGNGRYRGIAVPISDASVQGINPAGTALVGYYYVSSSGLYYGFLYQNKTLTTLQFPGATRTFANGINDAGEVVGNFQDVSGNNHGFIWTPPADAARK